MEEQNDVPSHCFEHCLYLDPKMESISDATLKENEKVIEPKRKHQEDKFVCQGHIMNSLLDCLYNLYMPITSTIESWKALESKYNIERQGTDKFLIMRYFDF